MPALARSVPLATLLATLSFVAAPEADAASPAACGPHDLVETGLQGQMPIADRMSGRAERGYTCNLREVGAIDDTSFASFETYGDCAYYGDTLGLYAAEGGTVVLDVSDPRRPIRSDYLTARSMRNPGESLRVNQRRGLLVADRYTWIAPGKATDPDTARSLAVYDLKGDCRHPKLLSDSLMPSATGHEGCFDPDGNVYYMASTETITPIDLTDPSRPKQLSEPWKQGIHGCSTSDDGTRGYFGDLATGRLLIADTTEVHQRRPGASMRQVAELPTPGNTGQQSTIPVTYGGRPYLVDWSEWTELGRPCTPGAPTRKSNFSYPMIVDIADERQPSVVSEIHNEVMRPENCAEVVGDSATVTTFGLTAGDVFPLLGTRIFLYDTHYCSTDRLHDPTILACSQFGSGLRVYDIRNPRRPREIAYYNPGTVRSENGSAPIANAVVARPVIRSDLGQIWFADIAKGFHAVQFRDGVWPFKGQDPCPHRDHQLAQYDRSYADCRAERRRPVRLPSARPCRTTTDLVIRLRRPGRIRALRYSTGGRVRSVPRERLGREVRLSGLPRRDFVLRVSAETSHGHRQAQPPVPRLRAAATRARGLGHAALGIGRLRRARPARGAERDRALQRERPRPRDHRALRRSPALEPRVDRALGEGDRHGVLAVAGSELAQQVLDPAADGVRAHVEQLGDLLRRPALGQPLEHVALARRQTGTAAGGRDAVQSLPLQLHGPESYS